MSKLHQFGRGAGIAVAVAMLCAAGATNAASEPFDVAELFFELNDTDEDLGIHGFIDGGPWTQVTIEDPGNRTLLDIMATSRLRKQRMTELFFESAEPSFDEQSPEQFFKLFPAGTYEIMGFAPGIGVLQSNVELSHVMPAPADNILIGGNAAAEDCDADPLPAVPGDEALTIQWDAVTSSHPDLGDPGAVTVAEYEVVVESEDESAKLTAHLPPGQTQLEVPASFLALADEFKLEILVRATNLNRTAVETCFEVE